MEEMDKEHLPALASETALEMALLEMARFRFMISSNSASLRGVRAASISLFKKRKGWGGVKHESSH